MPVWKLECFQTEIPEVCLKAWENHYSNYRNDMTSALDNSGNSAAAAAVYEKYRKVNSHLIFILYIYLCPAIDVESHSDKCLSILVSLFELFPDAIWWC